MAVTGGTQKRGLLDFTVAGGEIANESGIVVATIKGRKFFVGPKRYEAPSWHPQHIRETDTGRTVLAITRFPWFFWSRLVLSNGKSLRTSCILGALSSRLSLVDERGQRVLDAFPEKRDGGRVIHVAVYQTKDIPDVVLLVATVANMISGAKAGAAGGGAAGAAAG